MWHGIASLFCTIFPYETAVLLDQIVLCLLILVYLIINGIFLLWLKIAYSLRKEIKNNDLDKRNVNKILTQSFFVNTHIEEQKQTDFNINKRNSVISTVFNIDQVNHYRNHRENSISEHVKNLFTKSKQNFNFSKVESDV